MKGLLKTIALSLALLVCSVAMANRQTDAASALAKRILPRNGAKIEFVQVDSDEDFYSLETLGKHLVITGNDANSMAVGLNNYLRDYCNVDVSWYVRDAVSEPRRLPAVPEKVTRKALVKHRFFLNYCTYGYSLAWWQWKDWERMIDWMAMNGVNLALANTGQEAVWQKVWQEFGLTEEQTRAYFTGPGYLPWHRMSNIDGWHGPLPQSWIDGQAALQKQIVARELELGIDPILTSFNGHVPVALKELNPDADISKLSDWGHYPLEYNCWYLNPSDPLYDRIQKAFLRTQKEMFGQDCHIYGVDPFNEVDPPSWDADYLESAAKRTYEALAESDPDAVWLQMGWLFYYDKHWTNDLIEAYMRPVPKGRLLMIDYYCEKAEVYRRTDSFYGQDFIWSYLGNFGGNTMLSGNFKDVSAKLDRAYAEAGSGFVGVGCTLEGLGVDPPMFEYTLDRAWEKNRSDEEWIAALADRQLGRPDENYRASWLERYDKCYNNLSGERTMVVSARPNLKGLSNWNHIYKCDNHDLLHSWAALLDARPSKTPAFRFDCVNLARQCMENYFTDLVAVLNNAYRAKDAAAFEATAATMVELLDDIDELVGADPYFLLGKWIADARKWGADAAEKDYFEHDARMLITVWAYKGAGLSDYAARTYNGLVSSYYKPRWEAYIADLRASMESGTKFDAKAFKSKTCEVDWAWATEDLSVFPSQPSGNPVRLSRKFYKKYHDRIEASVKP